jgi:transcriptional regulator with XRE-family HTH domain
LRAVRTAFGLSQRELAKRAGVTNTRHGRAGKCRVPC